MPAEDEPTGPGEPGPDEAADGSGTALVATLLPNPATAIEVLRAWETGDAILPLNPALPRPEIDRILAAARPTHLVDGTGRHTLADGVPVPDGTAAVICTSGTTGAPKAVILTHDGMTVMGQGVSAAVGAGAGDVWLACHGLHFVAGLAILGRSRVTGIPVAVHDGFDLERVAAAPRDSGATIVSVVPTTLRRMLAAGATKGYRAAIVGGAPLPGVVRREAEAAGLEVYDAYGLTESWGGCITNGVPNEGVLARLADDDEIQLYGSPITPGYRFAPDLTTAAFTGDGWFRTGDVGAVDDEGRLRVVDRLKDLIISGGINVSPTEVEAVLLTHPAVADCYVVGAPDDEWGERVVACVVPRDEASPPTLDALRGFVREQLNPAKAPRELRIIAEVPRSPNGKILRRG